MGKKQGRRRSRRRYSADEKREVVEEARASGVVATARKHGICESNVSRWLAATRISDEEPVARTLATEPKTASPSTKPRFKKAVAKSYTPSQKAEVMEEVGRISRSRQVGSVLGTIEKSPFHNL